MPAGLDVAMTDKALARGLGFLTAAAMALTQAPVGFVRDEGYYFTAAQNAETWLRLLLHSPLQAVAQTERYWSYNFEHPGLTKLLFAASHLLFTTWLRILPDALAWRLPAFAFAGLDWNGDPCHFDCCAATVGQARISSLQKSARYAFFADVFAGRPVSLHN